MMNKGSILDKWPLYRVYCYIVVSNYIYIFYSLSFYTWNFHQIMPSHQPPSSVLGARTYSSSSQFGGGILYLFTCVSFRVQPEPLHEVNKLVLIHLVRPPTFSLMYYWEYESLMSLRDRHVWDWVKDLISNVGCRFHNMKLYFILI